MVGITHSCHGYCLVEGFGWIFCDALCGRNDFEHNFSVSSHSKMSTLPFLLFTFFFSLTLILSYPTQNLDPNRVWLVNYHKFPDNSINFLYRGNAPLNNSQFAYNELVSIMTERAQQSNLTFPSQFYFVDISYKNTTPRFNALKISDIIRSLVAIHSI